MTPRSIVAMSKLRLGVPSDPIDHFDDSIEALGRDLVDTMRSSPACVGIAAPQIGVELAAFALDCSTHRRTTSCHGTIVVCNPVVQLSGAWVREREGCMSVPDLTGDVIRRLVVVLDGRGVDGAPIHLETEGFEARAIQHEVDHLDGLLFVDRLSGPGALHRRRVYR